MKSPAKAYTSDFASFSAAGPSRLPRPFWSSTPVAGRADDLCHETEVIRGVMLAVPISIALWAPLVVAAFYCF